MLWLCFKYKASRCAPPCAWLGKAGAQRIAHGVKKTPGILLHFVGIGTKTGIVRACVCVQATAARAQCENCRGIQWRGSSNGGRGVGDFSEVVQFDAVDKVLKWRLPFFRELDGAGGGD